MDHESTPSEAESSRPARSRSAPGPRPGASDPDTVAPPTRAARTLRPSEQPANPQTAGAQPAGAQLAGAQPQNAQSSGGRPAAEPRPVPGIGAPVETHYPADTRHAITAETAVPRNIYRARRPSVAAFLILPAVGVGLLLIRALAVSAFGDTFLIGGVIASSLALTSLPLLVAGLYGLITGAAYGAEQWGFRVWARPPLAYLVVGIAFVIAAGLAIS